MTVTEKKEKKDDSRFREFTESDYDSYIAQKLDERFSRIEQQFARIEQQFDKKGKGRGKGKKNQHPQPSVSEAREQRLRSYMNDIRACPSTSSSGLFTEDEDLPLRPKRNQTTPALTTTKTVYIKKIDCQINNTSVDQGTFVS